MSRWRWVGEDALKNTSSHSLASDGAACCCSSEAAAACGGPDHRLFVSPLLRQRPQRHHRRSETHDRYDVSLCCLIGSPKQATWCVFCLFLSSDSVRPLLSQSVQEQLSAPSTSFELTYDLGLAALCADFRENIEFQFSLGWTALVTRFIGAVNAKRALSGSDPRLQVFTSPGLF